jgi:hypothetical protein
VLKEHEKDDVSFGILKQSVGDKSQSRNFNCEHPNCNKVFACKKSLLEHLRIHTGVRPFRW